MLREESPVWCPPRFALRDCPGFPVSGFRFYGRGANRKKPDHLRGADEIRLVACPYSLIHRPRRQEPMVKVNFAKNRVQEAVKKCWDSQPAAEAAIDSGRGQAPGTVLRSGVQQEKTRPSSWRGRDSLGCLSLFPNSPAATPGAHGKSERREKSGTGSQFA